MHSISVFTYTDKEIRTVLINGEVWFVAKDVCDMLEIINHRDALIRLPNSMKDEVGIADAIGRTQQTSVINEAGVYKVIADDRQLKAIFEGLIREELAKLAVGENTDKDGDHRA